VGGSGGGQGSSRRRDKGDLGGGQGSSGQRAMGAPSDVPRELRAAG
jgi:hypothetical protein